LRLDADLSRLAAFTSATPGVTRLAWTREHLDALDWLLGRAREAGMEAELDPVGNLIARWEGEGDGKALALGSHVDSVPDGGRFDGSLGVLSALNAVERLRDRGFEPKRPIWVVAFMDEEGARFGESMLGSRTFAGEDLSDYIELVDADGITVADAMRLAGFDPDARRAAAAVDRIGAYLELHVEQGRVLEEADVDIGVVTAIVGLLQAQVIVRGQVDHGGATPMPGRRDALVAASRVVVELRDWALDRSETTVTVGSIGVVPGAYNVIPGECQFSVDLRTAGGTDFENAPGSLRAFVERIAAEEDVEVDLSFTDRIAPARLDERLLALIEQAAHDEGATQMRMPSGAGHDAQVLARLVPSAMIFVPSVEGVSHSPRELTTPSHCELGVRVLARVIELLDRAWSDPDGGRSEGRR